jgi:uncharacterized protein YjbI with pentapeptide repeats
MPVKKGQLYCRWHDPEDESWRETYERLEKSTPEEKTDLVLKLIEEHPEHRLELPQRDEQRANLAGLDLSRETLARKRIGMTTPPWWSIKYNGANLAKANLQGAILNSGNFEGANLYYAQLQNAGLFGANLKGAYLYNADFQDARLVFVNLQSTTLSYVNFRNADLREARLQGVNLSWVGDMSNVSISGAWLDKTRIQHEKLGNVIGEETEHDYANAKRGYLALKQNFDDLGDYEAASWAYRKERRMEKLEARQKGRDALRTYEYIKGSREPKERNWREAASSYFKYGSDTFVEWLCDYGESVWRVVGWMVALLFIVGPLVFSGLGGIVWSKELTRDYHILSSWPKFWLWYRTYLLYTLDTLTTASFSGLQPINDVVKLASGFFAIAGIVLAGLLGFVAGNRIRRS